MTFTPSTVGVSKILILNTVNNQSLMLSCQITAQPDDKGATIKMQKNDATIKAG